MMDTELVVPHTLRVGEDITVVLGLGLSTLAVIIRIWTKARLTRTMQAEDYFSLLAWLSFLSYIALTIEIGTNGGDPSHKSYLSQVETIYCPIIALVKISILLQYITIFVVHRGSIFHILVHLLLWTNVVFYTIVTFLVIFECNPRARVWDTSIPGHCISMHQLGVSTGAFNVASDFIILFLPLHLIARLQMPWHKKWRVYAVFAVAFFGCVAAIMRLVYSIELNEFSATTSPAQQWVTGKRGLWALAEIAVGIIVGCMPVLPRFFKQSIFTQLCHSPCSRRGRTRSSASSSQRTLRQWLFSLLGGGNKGQEYTTGSLKVRESGGQMPKRSKDTWIGTQMLTRADTNLDGAHFPQEPSPTHSKEGLVPVREAHDPVRDGSNNSRPHLPGSAESDNDLRWQEMSWVEKADPAVRYNLEHWER